MFVSLAAALVLSSVPMPGEDEGPRFKEYFEKGEALYGQGEYGRAIHFFKLADARRVTPEVAYDLAKCAEKLNEQPFIVYYYRLYMMRAPQAPDTLAVSEKVGKLLGKLESEGKGFLELQSPRGRAIVVAGKSFPEGPAALFLPKGEYDVSAEFPGGRKAMKVQLRAGKATSINFEPVRPPLLAMEMALPAEVVARGGDSASPQGPSLLRLASYGAIGVGATALVTGIVLGAMSSASANMLVQNRALPPNQRMPQAQAQALANDANGKAVGANVMLVLGGAAAVGGGVMFYFSLPEPGMKKAESVAR